MTLEKTTRLIEQFENCTLPKERWTHEAHFIMAFWYCLQYPLPTAVHKIRDGIKKYNVGVGGQNTDSSGYHETITLFYISAIANFIIANGITELSTHHINGLLQQPFIARDYAYRFYTKEQLTSVEARRIWIEPKLQPSLLV